MTAALLAVLVVALQVATGAVWWALLRRASAVSALELLGMGVALGTFGSMICAILLVGTPLHAVGWLVPTVIAVPILVIARTGGRMGGFAITYPGPELLAGAVGLVAGGALVVVNSLRIPLDAPVTTSFADLYFFEALSRGLAQSGPAESILMSGGALRYHWFTYAWAGQVADLAGTGPFVLLTRVLPLVTLVGAAALAAAWAGRLSRVRWVPTLAVLLVVVGGYAGALYGSILNFDSPSQAMATVWLLAFATVLLARVRGDIGATGLIAVAALACACTGGKISHALVAAGGAGLLALVGLVLRRGWWRRALVAALVAGAAMAVTYVIVLSGVSVAGNLSRDLAVKASTWQGLDPLPGRLGVALGSLALLLAVLARVSGLGWLLGHRATRLSPDVLVATGGLAVGVLAMAGLREGVNELWFVLAASAPAAVVSAHGVGRALSGVRRREADGPLRRPLAWSVVVAVPATAACLVLSRNWTEHQAVLNWLAPVSVWLLAPVTAAVVVVAVGRRRSLATVLALTVGALTLAAIGTRPSSLWTSSRAVVTEAGTVQPDPTAPAAADPAAPTTGTPTTGAAASPEQAYAWEVEAAAWLTDHTDDGDLIATGTPVSALVPALTGRQMFLAGAIYQAGLGRADEAAVVLARTRDSLAFAADPTTASAAPLCAAGVDYVWLDGAPAADGAGGQVAFSNPGVTVLRLAGPGCG